jgi:hypothetical protein
MDTLEIGMLDVGRGICTLRDDELGAVRLMTDAEVDAVNGGLLNLAIFLLSAAAGCGSVLAGAALVNSLREPEVLVPNLFP